MKKVVFIHPLGGSTHSWKFQLESNLFVKSDLLAIDLPGYGTLSGHNCKDPHTYSYSWYAQYLANEAVSKGFEDAVFVGWSIGGHLILQAAELMPNARGFYLTCACPFGVTGPIDPVKIKQALGPEVTVTAANAAERLGGYFSSGEVPQSWIDSLLRSSATARNAIMRSMYDGTPLKNECDVIRLLAEKEIPVTGAWGQLDKWGNTSAIMSANLPWSVPPLFHPTAGHGLPWEHHEELNKHLADFLASIE